MNFLIIGDGPDERAWAQAIRATPHRVIATVPPHEPGDPAQDFETALATANLHAAVVGGTIADRAEALRRVVMLGLPAICLHPPGATADAYYQIALAHSENPPVVVPDLPMRLHPAFAAIQARLIEAGNPRPRSVRAEVAVPPGRDLLHEAFPRVADGVWALVGAIDSLTATGAPPGKRPDRVLAVHLTALEGPTAELRVGNDHPGPGECQLIVSTDDFVIMWYFDYSLTAPSRLARQQGGPPETIAEFPPWDPRRAVLEALDAALAGAPGAVDLPEGMRAMELAEAAERSLKRGRTVEMHYDEISELSSFKASMTSIGCALVLLSLVLYVLSRVGLALGIDAAKYLAWAVVPLLGIYGLLQFLRFAARPANADPSR